METETPYGRRNRGDGDGLSVGVGARLDGAAELLRVKRAQIACLVNKRDANVLHGQMRLARGDVLI